MDNTESLHQFQRFLTFNVKEVSVQQKEICCGFSEYSLYNLHPQLHVFPCVTMC